MQSTLTLPLALAALTLGAAHSPPAADSIVGDPLPPTELEDFRQTEATSFADFRGRLILIEFFEHW